MVFSQNQVQQLYVAKSAAVRQALTNQATVGAVGVVKNTLDNTVYIQSKGYGGLVRSDIIPAKNILSVTLTDPQQMAYTRKAKLVTLNEDINGGAPVAGLDYILRLTIMKYIGLSEDNQYEKYGAVHATSGMTADAFYKAMVISLFLNFAREEAKFFEFVIDGKVITKVVRDSNGQYKVYGVTGTTSRASAVNIEVEITSFSDGIIIQEAVQPWELGTMPQTNVDFVISAAEITYDGDDLANWLNIEDAQALSKDEQNPTIITNGHKIADLEYFCMGNRGDQYRMMGYPNVVTTKYMVDPEQTYWVLNIHYAYVGSNESVQKSEKDITVVATNKDYLTPITQDLVAVNKDLKFQEVTGHIGSTVVTMSPEE